MTKEDPCVVTDHQAQGLVDFPPRDGVTFDLERDGERLHKQHNRVLACIRDGQWRSLSAIAQATGDPEASVSARLRDLRKPKFGGHTIERRYVARGLWEYRLGALRAD